MITHTVNTNINSLYEVAEEALINLDINIDNWSFEEGIINASTKTSLLSWGEEITIRFRKVNLNQTKVEVTSISNAQLIDWGTNSENENGIIDEFNRILKIR
ncbi:MAG: hypothetical protein RJQ00_05260 [Vicingaceae bacterium]